MFPLRLLPMINACFPPCVCLFSCLCWLVSWVARWDLVSQRHFSVQLGCPTQCAQPALAVWTPTEGCVSRDLGGCGAHAQVCEQEGVVEKNLETHGKKGQNRKCRDVVSLRVWCRCVALCGGYCGKEVEMPGPAIPFPRTPRRHTESRSSPKWTETNTVFWKTNVAQTTDISKNGFSCRSSSSPRGYLMSRADWCALRGVAGCECATLPNMEIAAF